MNLIKHSTTDQSPGGFSLLGLLVSLVILAILAVLLLQAMGGRNSGLMESLGGSESSPVEVPEWDGSLESRLPDAIEAKVRGVQDQAAERQAQLEKMLENSY